MKKTLKDFLISELDYVKSNDSDESAIDPEAGATFSKNITAPDICEMLKSGEIKCMTIKAEERYVEWGLVKYETFAVKSGLGYDLIVCDDGRSFSVKIFDQTRKINYFLSNTIRALRIVEESASKIFTVADNLKTMEDLFSVIAEERMDFPREKFRNLPVEISADGKSVSITDSDNEITYEFGKACRLEIPEVSVGEPNKPVNWEICKEDGLIYFCGYSDGYKNPYWSASSRFDIDKFAEDSVIIKNEIKGIPVKKIRDIRANNLKKIIIPKSIKEISGNAFHFCESLTDIIYKGTKEEWENIEKSSGWLPNEKTVTITFSDGSTEVPNG